MCKDLIYKEAYFEVGSILEELFKIKHDHGVKRGVGKPVPSIVDRIVFLRNVLMRKDPVQTIICSTGTRIERCYLRGINYNPNECCSTTTLANNVVIREEHKNKKGEYYREDGPALILRNDDGSVREGIYYHGDLYWDIDSKSNMFIIL